MNGQTDTTENYLLFLKIYCHTCPDPTTNAETTIPEFSTIVFTNQIVFDQSQIPVQKRIEFTACSNCSKNSVTWFRN